VIDAPPRVVWQVMSEVESWPEWTASVTEIVRVDPGPLHVGQRLRIRQPRLPSTVWRLTELTEERSVTWRAGGPGATTTAHHHIEPVGSGTEVTLRLTQQGPLGVLVGALTSKLTRRYLELETSGLKRRCES
jgi:hypothetical protein